ncbi:MAG: serine hydrolase domain-containing protein [Pyrinomonadaceae bacterium]
MHRRSILLFTILFLFSAPANADVIDDLVRSQLIERHIPGAAVAVVKNGRVVKMKGYGLASVEFNVPVTTETVFEIGSVSKQMTAAGIMLLVEDGKVNLDEKISKYLPNTPEAWKNVSVRNLLTHTSGIKNYSSLDGFELSNRLKVDGFIKLLSPHPLEFEPGERNIYSNSGFNLLAFIIESASGKSYIDFMKTRIFKPLGMAKTTDRDPDFIIINRAAGYEWRVDKLTGRDGSLTDLRGAGSIVSTISDMAKWEAALRNDTLLKKASKNEMWKQFVFNDGKPSPYGFGWRISDVRGHKLVAHSGQTAGFGASISRFIDDDLSVIALTNLGETGMGTLVATSVAKNYLPAISLRAVTAKPDADPKISAKFLTVLRERTENKFDPELMSAELIKAFSTERTKNEGKRIGTFGMPRSVVFVGSEATNGKTVYRYKAETPKRMFLWRIAINTQGKITEMTLEDEE